METQLLPLIGTVASALIAGLVALWVASRQTKATRAVNISEEQTAYREQLIEENKSLRESRDKCDEALADCRTKCVECEQKKGLLINRLIAAGLPTD